MNEEDSSALDGIRRDAQRMQHRRRHPGASPLSGLGAFGVVGWSVAVPTVGGALLGLWLDRIAPQRFSWTLALILGGVAIGVLVAWDWIGRENRKSLADRPRRSGKEQPHD
ncbi:MAG: ATPase F0F1 [Rubrivivax sp. SCN 71-131]|jgi:ATP synthase protein I|nr:MAG: ATPase F0F1 [Rubrivivax sp. SCN 71-131]